MVVDLGLLACLRQSRPDLEIILSNLAHVTNSGSVEFFREIGARRIVLPRHLSLAEIGELLNRHPHVDFEVFIKNQDCFFAQGRCYFTHDVVNSEVPYRCGLVVPTLASRELCSGELEALGEHRRSLFNNCGVCAVQQLERVGVKMVKLVGRNLTLEDRLRDVAFIRRAIAATW